MNAQVQDFSRVAFGGHGLARRWPSSDTSSLPEVVGDAGIMVDPHDVRALAEAMERVLMDEHLRAGLRAKGLERAKQFTWERAARETMEVYREVATRC